MKKNENIKAIFIDLDWTLIDHRKGKPKFDKKSFRGLKKAQQRGVKVIYCTARPYHSVFQVGALKIFKPDGLICCNGGMASIDNKVIYQHTFKHEDLHAIAEVVLSNNLNMECTECFDRFLIAPENDIVKDCFSTYYEVMPEVKDYKNKDIISILLFSREESDEKIRKELPKGITFWRFHRSGVDVFSTPHEKGTGVVKALEYLKLFKDNCIAFGDDIGDISMFKEVGIGVAMKNGKDKTKGASSYVTKEVWKHGVYHGLKHFKII